MNLELRIDSIYEKIQTAPLSNIVSFVLPISLELLDYEGYCILSYWCKPMTKEVKSNITKHNDIKKVLLSEGLSSEEIKKISEAAFDKYLDYRCVGKDQVLVFSVREIEDRMKYIDDAISAIEPPDGLAPVDLYFRSAEVAKQKISLMESKQQLEQQYAVFESYIITKLAEYRRKATLQERKNMLENGIKNSKNIFIIHGHNEAKRRELEKILKESFGLNPVVLLEQPDQGLTIIEKFEKYASGCSYAFALFTPDDIVTNGDKQYFQASPNVIFELGWFYANLGRSRVCILDQASDQSKIFSDLQGILRMQFNENISEKYMEIERELKSLGII